MGDLYLPSLSNHVDQVRLFHFVSPGEKSKHFMDSSPGKSATVVEMPTFHFPSGWSAVKSPKGDGSGASQGLP